MVGIDNVQHESDLEFGVTVIIPTYNRKVLLEKSLNSLLTQDLSKQLYEVIVVDDGSSDGTEHLVRDFQHQLNVRYFYQEDLGFRVAKARNIGIANAHFAVVMFLDCGMLAHPKLLSRHLQRHRAKQHLVCIGLSYGLEAVELSDCELIQRLLETHTLPDAITQCANIPHLQDCRTALLQKYRYDITAFKAPWVLFWTSCISVQLFDLKRIGGFDEWFNHWGGEDVDVGFRLYQLGCQFEVMQASLSIHYPHPKNIAERERDAKANVNYLINKHNNIWMDKLDSLSWYDLCEMSSNEN
ncbi:glycosyltransferase [Pseudoalteromonas fenneropenaei]|uniref:Glycosyltransferase n=1 Tax=Pseudoalteromonas fenneropenaei TaxID=1737459 RepID=A0ABV7CJX0_9GAMM